MSVLGKFNVKWVSPKIKLYTFSIQDLRYILCVFPVGEVTAEYSEFNGVKYNRHYSYTMTCKSVAGYSAVKLIMKR